MCDRWRDFANFYEDMGNPPFQGASINRVNNDGDYCPDNCEWATQAEQHNNTRRNHRLMLNGQIHTVTEWAERMGCPAYILFGRIGRGWSTERVLTTPVKRYKLAQ